MLEQCLYFLFLALAEHFEQQGPNVIARVAKETLRCTSIYASCSFRKKWQTVENQIRKLRRRAQAGTWLISTPTRASRTPRDETESRSANFRRLLAWCGSLEVFAPR
jgi:hypothetical protein